MSTEGKASAFGLVNRVMAMLNVGDSAKMDSFFTRSIKVFNREIGQITSNLNFNVLTKENEIEEQNDRLEDAKGALDNAYTDIDVESIQTNANQDAYMNTYFGRVEDCENAIEVIEDSIKDLRTDIKDLKANAKDEIQVRKDRIARINKA